MSGRISTKYLDRVLLAAGGLSSLIGVLVIVGWHSHNITLLKVFPAFEAMRYNTALGFVASGVGLLLVPFNKPLALKACGLAVGFLGLLTLIQYITGVDLGVDQVLIGDTISSSYPGRMALSTALGFSFTGAALFVTGLRRWPSRMLGAGIIGSIIISFGITALFGHVTGTASINAWGGFIAMAVNTAVGFTVVGFGVLASAWREDMADGRGDSRWLPILVISVGLVTGSLILWRVSAAQERRNIESAIGLKAGMISYDIRSQMESRVQALVRMANRWQANRPSRQVWESDARLYLEHLAGFRSIGWIDASSRPRWFVDSRGVNAPTPGESGFWERSAPTSRDKEFITEPFPLEGGMGFAAFAPISGNDGFEGFIVGVFAVQEFFDLTLAHDTADGYSVEIFSGAAGKIYGRYGGGAIEPGSHPQEAYSDLYGALWRSRVWPDRDALSRMRSPLPEIILAAGIISSALLGLLIYFAQTARRRARAAEAANRGLEVEVAERKRAEEEAEWHARELACSNVELEREVVERRRAEEQSTRHEAELARSNAELEQFAYVASHDLQEPLRVIAGYVQLLSRRYRGKLDTNADEFIAFAVDGATRMQELINDLLAYSRVGSKGRELMACDWTAVMKETLVNLRQAIEENDAAVTCDPLPCVVADASQLGQLFQNIIANAIKYRSGKAPRVHVSAIEKNREWQFSVSDNGIGIEPKYHDRIFIIFQRLHGKNEYSGTGIGLAICKKIVEKHGGRIWVESEPGEGSTFHFTMPNNRGQR